MQTKNQRWETRPLQCWQKAKEIRKQFEESRIKAAANNKILVDGRDSSIFAALGDLQSTMTNPLGSMIAFNSNKFARQCQAATELNGMGREICGYHRNVFGSMYLNRDMLGGPCPRRNVSIPTPAPCDQHSKRGQPMVNYYRIPTFQGECPIYEGPLDPERNLTMQEHRTDEILDQIEWLEKITGRTFDDEIFAEMVKSAWRTKPLAAEVYCMQQNIPAPLDMKSLYSFYTLGGLVMAEQGAVEGLWRALRDEVKFRVENHIAGVGTERYRFIEDEPPPWYFLKYYRYLETFGAVGLGSHYLFHAALPFEMKEDGTYIPPKNPIERGLPLKTRRDVVLANQLVYGPSGGGGRKPRSEEMVDFARAFKADGAILPLWDAGVGCVYGRRESGLELTKAGVKIMYYEGSQPGDRTDFDENRMIDQLDNWMESQGLKKLED